MPLFEGPLKNPLLTVSVIQVLPVMRNKKLNWIPVKYEYSYDSDGIKSKMSVKKKVTAL